MKCWIATLLVSIALHANAGVALYAGDESKEVGAASFFHCFVSTVSVNLEPVGPGTRFPVLVRKLVSGTVASGELEALRLELQTIRQELNRFPPSRVVWDINRRDKLPPWGSKISPSISSLGNYFVTSEGEDLFEVLFASLARAASAKRPLELK
jgi:2,3-bisphosphoglycerate-dependent phosphoglycerate mutase